jgi:hypothetical protein
MTDSTEKYKEIRGHLGNAGLNLLPLAALLFKLWYPVRDFPPNGRDSTLEARLRRQLRPPLHPPDQGLPPVNPTKGASPSGFPTGRVALPWTPARCFGSGFDQESLRALHGPPQTVGDFALPLDPHRPAVRRLDPRQGFRAHGPRTGGRAAPVPLPNPWRIGCAVAARAAETTSAPCPAWAALLEAHTWTR